MMAHNGNVMSCRTTQFWLSKLQEAKTQSKLIVVDFTATWCGPCRIMAPFFVELSIKYSDVVFLKVDVDQLEDVTTQWNVQAMPTFILIKDGEEVGRIVGSDKQELERKLAQNK
eukprot:c54055_g1_i1 orf=133-474(-)